MKIIKVILIFYLILEIIGIIYVSNKIGFFIMFAEIIVSAFIGGLILLNTKMGIIEALSGFSRQKISTNDFIRGNFSKVFGGILLILPGVFCDIFGLIILINAYFILRSKDSYQKNQDHNDVEEDIIDVEVEEQQEQK